jgi:hypothetical protein
MIIGKKSEISGSNSNAGDECSLLEWMACTLVYTPQTSQKMEGRPYTTI